VKKGQPIATIYATNPALLPEPIEFLKQAIDIASTPPEPVQLVSRIFTHEKAEAHLRDAVR
jgi:thymidine phosphorylase